MLNWGIFIGFIFISFSARFAYATLPESYSEDVNVLPLPDGHTAFHFDFSFYVPEPEHPIQHFHIFPKSLYEMVHQYGVEEMRLTMSRGYWDHARWGYAFMPAPPSSAALWTWFRGDTNTVDNRWKGFTESLSGHFCASLNRLGHSKDSISPRWSFPRWGLSRNPASTSQEKLHRERRDFLRFSQLVSEPLCTENLTPWLKLLPCRQRLGLASNLNPEKLMKSRYLELGVQLRPVGGDSACDSVGLELKLFLTVVFDHRLMGLSVDRRSWKELLSTVVKSTCPLARHTQLHVWLPTEESVARASLMPAPTQWISFPGLQLAVYNVSRWLSQESYLEPTFTLSERHLQSTGSLPQAPVTVSKFATGRGQEESGIQCLLRNHDPVKHFRVVLMDHVPWFMRIIFSSLSVHVNGHDKKPLRTHFVPSATRTRSGHLELVLHLPPQSTVRVQYRFLKLLQRWNEYPPDPHHGFYVPPSIVTVKEVAPEGSRKSKSTDSGVGERILQDRALPQDVPTYTEWLQRENSNSTQDVGLGVVVFSEPVLVTFPTPDFSMPFNVLCMVSTLLVLLYMTVHRHCTSIMLYTLASKQSLPQKLKEKVKNLLTGRKTTPAPQREKVD